MQIRKLFAAAVVASTLISAVSVGQDLTIGSVAPDLDIEHWVQDGEGKFEPVTKFEDGNVYVVEFWATWCGPCIASMPHLAEMQTEYADKGVQLISISDEPLDTVTSFLEKTVRGEEDQTYAELTRVYCLTTDPDRSSHADYMKAAGQNGIPTSFLVGKTGHIEWIGHPMRLDKPLEAVVKDEWDRDAFLEEFKLKQEVDLAIAGIQRAAGTGKFEEAVKLIDELVGKLPSDHQYFEPLQNMRSQLVVMSGSEDAIDTIKKQGKEAGEDPAKLNQLSWMIFQALSNNKSMDEEIASKYLVMGLYASKKAAEASPDDPAILDTYARLLHHNGDLDKAIEIQTKAVDNANGRMKTQLRAFLTELKNEKDDAEESEDEEEESEESDESDEDEES